MNELALFAGCGGGILAGHMLGWRTVAAVEIEDYPRRVLLQRQADGLLPRFPIWDDVCTFDGRPWRGRVNVISGGFPCQDISAAGKGKGITGERSGLWKEMARIIGEVRPRYAFVENSPMLATRGLERVLADLTAMGYDSRWGVISAADIGANHKRERIWIVAHTSQGRYKREKEEVRTRRDFIKLCGEQLADTDSKYVQGQQFSGDTQERPRQIMAKPALCGGASNRHWWQTEPNVGRVADGVANRVDRLKAIGNGQVPLCAATAWRILK